MRLINRKPALTVVAVSAALALVAFAGTPVLPASARTPSAVKSAQAPIAAFTATTSVIHNFCGFWAFFNASGSIAPAGTSITQYTWSFGDGSGLVTTSPTAFHGYRPGTYHVVLTVTDSNGTSASTSPHLITGGSGCRSLT
jgi:PKD repeat protein